MLNPDTKLEVVSVETFGPLPELMKNEQGQAITCLWLFFIPCGSAHAMCHFYAIFSESCSPPKI